MTVYTIFQDAFNRENSNYRDNPYYEGYYELNDIEADTQKEALEKYFEKNPDRIKDKWFKCGAPRYYVASELSEDGKGYLDGWTYGEKEVNKMENKL